MASAGPPLPPHLPLGPPLLFLPSLPPSVTLRHRTAASIYLRQRYPPNQQQPVDRVPERALSIDESSSRLLSGLRSASAGDHTAEDAGLRSGHADVDAEVRTGTSADQRHRLGLEVLALVRAEWWTAAPSQWLDRRSTEVWSNSSATCPVAVEQSRSAQRLSVMAAALRLDSRRSRADR